MKVLFNADDFGLTKGVTDGIIEAYKYGVVRSTTILMNGPAKDYAITRAKEHPHLHIGVHLVLTMGQPILKQMNHLINTNGEFRFTNRTRTIPLPARKQIRQEWMAQIELFLQSGLTLHHIDSHHHIHGLEDVKEIVVELAQLYNVPVRYTESLKEYKHILLTESAWLDFYHDGINEQIFEQLRTIDTPSIEVMTHPAKVDQQLRQFSSYVEYREKELDILKKLSFPSWAQSM